MSSLQRSRLAVRIDVLRAISGAAVMVATAVPMQALAVPLSFSSDAQVYGNINSRITSPLLGGDVSFTLNGPQDYKYNNQWSGFTSTTGVASVSYVVPTGQGGVDPIYDAVTSAGQYGFSYTGQAEAAGLTLKTKIATATVDSNAQLADSPVSYMYAYSQAGWNQQFYIGATAARPTGSYGAILISYTLEGNFPALSDPTHQNNSQAWSRTSTSFTDTAGVSYSSYFDVSAYPWDASWTGHSTVFKKLLFQYGTVFSIDLYQYAYSGANGAADFFNTGFISSIELPFEATLDSGAQQAGIGSLAQLYGNVYNSATVDDINTNWDFGNNGGGFNPPVPEPETWALLLGGLGVVGCVARRRSRGFTRPEVIA